MGMELVRLSLSLGFDPSSRRDTVRWKLVHHLQFPQILAVLDVEGERDKVHDYVVKPRADDGRWA